jgi:hypothetical protein
MHCMNPFCRTVRKVSCSGPQHQAPCSTGAGARNIAIPAFVVRATSFDTGQNLLSSFEQFLFHLSMHIIVLRNIDTEMLNTVQNTVKNKRLKRVLYS